MKALYIGRADDLTNNKLENFSKSWNYVQSLVGHVVKSEFFTTQVIGIIKQPAEIAVT